MMTRRDFLRGSLAGAVFLPALRFADSPTVSASLRSYPLGPPTPAKGWRVALGDHFNVPFSDNPLWHLNRDSCPVATDDSAGYKPFETEAFNASQITQQGSLAVLTAN